MFFVVLFQVLLLQNVNAKSGTHASQVLLLKIPTPLSPRSCFYKMNFQRIRVYKMLVGMTLAVTLTTKICLQNAKSQWSLWSIKPVCLQNDLPLF